MKKVLYSMLCAVIAVGTANAQSTSFDVDFEWAGVDTNFFNTTSFALPEVASIDSIDIELAHTWAGDIEISLTNGVDTISVVDNFGGNIDLGLVANDTTLANVATYSFTLNGLGGGAWPALGGGSFGNSVGDGTGPFAAGSWDFVINDTAGGDGGAVGNVTVNYTVIPEPTSALILLSGAGLALVRRRR